MNRSLTKPFIKNVRLDSPLGLLGVPPDSYHALRSDNTVGIPIGCRRGSHERFL